MPTEILHRFGKELVVTIHPDAILQLITMQRFDEMTEKLRALDKQTQLQLRPLFTSAIVCKVFRRKIQLSDSLMDYAISSGENELILVADDKECLIYEHKMIDQSQPANA